ncbi:acyl carrier protein [Butyrivibrio sp. VCD2006]|uniref:acyl carrier protein n=1 Tax=Butyrivibrio sp. VCD2006 TaxID=1280664 RepID=UPI00040E5899|nr:acyl carrier protein [Butyrivibrio sp. VCD2006]
MFDVERFIYDVFAVELTHEDYDRSVEEVLKWDSFMIASMMTELFDRYGKQVDLEKLFSIRTVRDVVNLITETVEN